MGYKIEIVLISIAVFLCGLIMLVIAFQGNEPEEIVVEKYISSTAASENTAVNHQYTDTTVDTAEATTSQAVNDDKIVGKININTAAKEELMQLDGIGEVLADRIIEYRKNSKFTAIEDIKQVVGIADAKFEKIKDDITVK